MRTRNQQHLSHPVPITRRKQQQKKIEQGDPRKEEKKERKTDAEGTAIKTAEDVETMHE